MHAALPPTIVLFGGPSTERRVSVASAMNLADCLGHVRFWFWSPSGAVVEVAAEALKAHSAAFERDFEPTASREHWATLSAALDTVQGHAPPTVVLLALHGGAGEDGTVQRELESRRIAFTGSGAEASALAMDKSNAKARVSAHGVPVARGEVLSAASVGDTEFTQRLLALFAAWGPLVVKPVSEGSSVGLGFVRAREDCEVVARGVQPGWRYLVEQLIVGRELTVGVVEDESGALAALPCSEVRLADGRDFDFAGKYLAGTEEHTPAQVPQGAFRQSQELAVRCHRALGCAGYSRTDLILTEQGPVFLETNTLPGLTKASFIPQQLQAEGRSLPEFLATQLALALARRTRRNRERA
jgi:D-alanine-D-alanine ligase